MSEMTELETLQLTRDGHVAYVAVSNPPMNVITRQMGLEFRQLLDQLAADDDVRVVVFRSATPGVFIAGADITMFGDISPDTMDDFRELARTMDHVAELPKPTIAELGGMTLGGGFELALACDFRFMSTGFGEIGLPEVRLGLLPGGGGTQRLPRLVGMGRATEMLMKGMRYTPEQAFEIGLVHRIFAPDELEAEVRRYAASLAAQAPLALRSIKRLVRAAFETPGSVGLELERDLFIELAQTADAREGISAFFEGRKPSFTGA